MACLCPFCQKEIGVFRIGSRFACPYFRSPVRSNVRKVASISLPISCLVEGALFVLFRFELGSTAVAIFAYANVCGLATLFIYWASVLQFVEVRSIE